MLTNKNALLANASISGDDYHGKQPFSTVEVRQFITPYILKG
jgi:hypothetical protein